MIIVLSSKSVGDTITRQQLMSLTGCYPSIYVVNGVRTNPFIDQYKRKLIIAKYLYISSRGTYTINKKIPINLSHKMLLEEIEIINQKKQLMRSFNV